MYNLLSASNILSITITPYTAFLVFCCWGFLDTKMAQRSILLDRQNRMSTPQKRPNGEWGITSGPATPHHRTGLAAHRHTEAVCRYITQCHNDQTSIRYPQSHPVSSSYNAIQNSHLSQKANPTTTKTLFKKTLKKQAGRNGRDLCDVYWEQGN